MDVRGRKIRRRIRFAIGFVIAGLILSGLTAFPLLHEVNLLAGWVSDAAGIPRAGVPAGLAEWILRVREGLADNAESYPFIAYGTDWLAFGHIVIALFFILPYREPLRYEGVLWIGVAASILVMPLALICGPIRGIPIYWRLIDCGFGVLCLLPLFWAIRLTRRLREEASDGGNL